MRSILIPTIAALFLAAPAVAEDEVKATALWVQDFRAKVLVKPKTPPSEDAIDLEARQMLYIAVKLEGGPAERCSAHKKDATYTVTDDKGNVLKQIPRDDDEEPGKYWPGAGLFVECAVPPRTATKVSIEGKMTLLVGKRSDIVLAEVSKLVGKKVEHKDLQNAGLLISVKSFEKSPNGEGTHVWLMVQGKWPRLFDIELLDEKDQVIGRGDNVINEIGYPTDEDEAPWVLYAKGGLDPAKCKLRISVLLDAKDTVVPFTLKDVPLP